MPINKSVCVLPLTAPAALIQANVLFALHAIQIQSAPGGCDSDGDPESTTASLLKMAAHYDALGRATATPKQIRHLQLNMPTALDEIVPFTRSLADAAPDSLVGLAMFLLSLYLRRQIEAASAEANDAFDVDMVLGGLALLCDRYHQSICELVHAACVGTGFSTQDALVTVVADDPHAPVAVCAAAGTRSSLLVDDVNRQERAIEEATYNGYINDNFNVFITGYLDDLVAANKACDAESAGARA